MGTRHIVFVLPSGDQHSVELPDDTALTELLAGLARAWSLPLVHEDGASVEYGVASRGLGRALDAHQTLSEADVPPSDRLVLTALLTAGSSVNESPRMRRLRADHQRMMELDSRSDLIDVKVVGPTPPERYIVTYHVPSVVGIDKKGEPKLAKKHQVEIYLHSDYPHRWPGLKWLTPIWHPNISHANGSVCIDAAWWGAARSLDRLVIMMGEMLQWKNFHDDPTKPPFPWDHEAAAWSREYRRKHPNVFPTDKRELMRPERVKVGTSPKPASKAESRVKLGEPKPHESKEVKGKEKPRIRLFNKK